MAVQHEVQSKCNVTQLDVATLDHEANHTVSQDEELRD